MGIDALATELKPLKNISLSFVPDTFETVHDVRKALTPNAWASERFFSRWGHQRIFPQVTLKIFPGG